jgi:hypothetical protein
MSPVAFEPTISADERPVDLRLRQRGHWDRPLKQGTHFILVIHRPLREVCHTPSTSKHVQKKKIKNKKKKKRKKEEEEEEKKKKKFKRLIGANRKR